MCSSCPFDSDRNLTPSRLRRDGVRLRSSSHEHDYLHILVSPEALHHSGRRHYQPQAWHGQQVTPATGLGHGIRLTYHRPEDVGDVLLGLVMHETSSDAHVTILVGSRAPLHLQAGSVKS